MIDFNEVGQAKVFALAAMSNDRKLAGIINVVNKDHVEVSFPVNMQNGIHGVTTKFIPSQFSKTPKVGQKVQVEKGVITLIG